MIPFFEEQYGLPSEPHGMGQSLLPALETSYKSIYTLLGAKEDDQFVFTSSGAEAITQVMHSVHHTIVRQSGKNHFVISEIADAATTLSVAALEDEGCRLQIAKVSRTGYVTIDAIAEAITPRTCLVSLPLTTSLTGVIQPLTEIAALCKQRAILLHVDVTHALGKLFIDFDELGANFITFNGDHIQAPKGTGGLFSRHAQLLPLIHGEEESYRLRGGSLNVPGLIGLGQAALEAESSKSLYCTEVARLRDSFESQLLNKYPEAQIPFSSEERLPHTTVVAFPGISNEALLHALSRKQLFASIGGGSFLPIEHILRSSGIDPLVAQSAIAFTLSKETTVEEINGAVTIISEAASRLRRLSKALVEIIET
jgi:cysteine desulfurase